MVVILHTQEFEQGKSVRVRANRMLMELLLVPEHDETGSPRGYSYWLRPLSVIYQTEDAAFERAKRDALRLTEPSYLAEQSDITPPGRSGAAS